MEIKRCYETIIGASVAENQLVQSGATSVTVQSGHKYYAKIDGTESLGTSTGSAITINDSAKDMVIDLTQKLGSAIADYAYTLEQATAGAGIAKLREWGFLKGYQAYNAGSIESVEVTEKKVVGFNQWDEEWKVIGAHIGSKNPIPCLPNTAYYMQAPYNPSNGLFFWTRDMVRTGTTRYNGGLFTTPSDCYYMTFEMTNAYGTTYNHDICINLSSDRNGEYEPYTTTSYPLGSDVLRGIFKLDASNKLYADGDRKTSDGVITRKWVTGTIPTSSRIYNATGVGTERYVLFTIPLPAKNSVTEVHIFADKMPGINFNNRGQAYNITINSYYADRVEIFVPADATLEQVNDFIAGQTFVYELATPTTEQGDPFPSPQVCYPDGTEEYVTSNGVPVGHESKYQL